ncbi:hypothetical protein G6F31_018345 [Rhizopus arrhizus]|nr:hypothetical protein G6F31_018345 [Rhizopus arrhizus]
MPPAARCPHSGQRGSSWQTSSGVSPRVALIEIKRGASVDSCRPAAGTTLSPADRQPRSPAARTIGRGGVDGFRQIRLAVDLREVAALHAADGEMHPGQCSGHQHEQQHEAAAPDAQRIVQRTEHDRQDEAAEAADHADHATDRADSIRTSTNTSTVNSTTPMARWKWIGP